MSLRYFIEMFLIIILVFYLQLRIDSVNSDLHRLKGVIEELVTLGVVYRDANGRYMSGTDPRILKIGTSENGKKEYKTNFTV